MELYARELEARGLAAATIALKLVVLTGFYRYCVEEQLLEHSPAVHVRRPKVPQESARIGLNRNELGAFLVQAGLSGSHDHMLACLLGLNALRVSEACGADLDDLAIANGHRHVPQAASGIRGALDRNPTYIVATYVAGATGAADLHDELLAADPGGGTTLLRTTRKPWFWAAGR